MEHFNTLYGASEQRGRTLTRIAGLVRFSYPAIGGFAHGNPDPARFLYDPSRLERRFRLFETRCLPSLRAQTDPDFAIVFLVGEDMPPTAHRRLADALHGLSQARIVALPTMPHYPATRQAFAALDTGAGASLTTFRLDDDDGLACDYIARLRALVKDLGAMRAADGPITVSFHRGLLLHQDGAITEVVEKLPPATGSAMIGGGSQRENIYRRNHRLLPQFFPHFSDVRQLAFLRSVHQDNDSTPHASGLARPLGAHEAETALREAFPFLLDSRGPS